jgi:hypothetical protein
MTLRDSQGNFIGSPVLGETTYEYDWFSGSQINLMIGDVLIDSCVGIQYNVDQTRTPIYGYASQYYTFVADGKVFVSGSITIAFKEAGYLFWPIQRFINRKVEGEWTTPRYDVDKQGRLTRGYDLSKSDGTFHSEARRAERKRTMKANVEQALKWQAGPERSGARYNRFWQELGHMEDDLFEDWAEVFEDSIWYGSDTANPLMRDKLFSNNIEENVQIDEEDVLSHRRADQYPAIDIWITYGDVARQAVNHTVKKIMDVSFVGQSQVIEISGEPTYETYQFIARNVV